MKTKTCKDDMVNDMVGGAIEVGDDRKERKSPRCHFVTVLRARASCTSYIVRLQPKGASHWPVTGTHTENPNERVHVIDSYPSLTSSLGLFSHWKACSRFWLLARTMLIRCGLKKSKTFWEVTVESLSREATGMRRTRGARDIEFINL